MTVADAAAGRATEADLLRRYVQAGDPEAFRAIVDAHGGMIFSVCRRILHNAADAEDAAQDCLLQFARKASRLRAPVSGWLHRAALHAAIDVRRRNASRAAREAKASETLSQESDPHWAELRGLVDEAIADLPERLRVVVVLRYLEGRSQAEIAAQLGIGQSAVSTRTAKGLERMRRHLLRNGLSLRATALGALLSFHAVQSAPAELAAVVGKITLAGVTTGSKVTAAKAAVGGVGAAKLGALSAITVSAVIVAGLLAYRVFSRPSSPPTAAPSQPAPLAAKEMKPAPDPDRRTGLLVSPDGQWLAYGVPVHDDAANGEDTRLVVSRNDGAEPRVVTTVPGQVDEVQWLGNEQLIYSSRAELRYAVVSLDGTPRPDLRLPTACNVLYKRISPNGKQVAFVGSFGPADEDRQFGLFVADLATGEVRRLVEEAVKTAPAWSPDSSRLAIGDAPGYVARYPLTIVDVNSGAKIRLKTGEARSADYEDLTRDGGGNVVQGVGAAWSPDGKSLAFTTEIVRGGSWNQGVPVDGRIGIFDLDDNAAATLTPPARHSSDPNTGWWEIEGAIRPVWSPDGRWIAYQKTYMLRADREAEVQSLQETWVVGRDGQRRRKIADGDNPVAWAPDSKSMFVLAAGELARVDVKTGAKWKLAAWKDPNRPVAPRPIISQADAKFGNDMAALKDVVWRKEDPVQKELTWYSLPYGLAVVDTAARTVRRYNELLGEPGLLAGPIAFGPDRVWLGTNKGLFVWNRKNIYWTRVAVGGTLVSLPVTELSLDDSGRLFVGVDQDGKRRKFEYDTVAATWREIP